MGLLTEDLPNALKCKIRQPKSKIISTPLQEGKNAGIDRNRLDNILNNKTKSVPLRLPAKKAGFLIKKSSLSWKAGKNWF